MIPLAKGETIHIVNGRQLSSQKYAQYRYDSGVDDGILWTKNKVARLNELAGDDKTFRAKVLTEFDIPAF